MASVRKRKVKRAGIRKTPVARMILVGHGSPKKARHKHWPRGVGIIPCMPELPEVETTRQSFADRIDGARVTAVRLGKPLRWPLGVAPDQLVGRTVGEAT